MLSDTERAQRCRLRAAEIRRLAGAVLDADARRGLLPLAERYDRLAADIVRLSKVWRRQFGRRAGQRRGWTTAGGRPTPRG